MDCLRLRSNLDLTKLQDFIYFPFFFDDLYVKFSTPNANITDKKEKYSEILFNFIEHEYIVIHSTKEQSFKNYLDEQTKMI